MYPKWLWWSVTFPLVPPWCSYFCFWLKCLYAYLVWVPRNLVDTFFPHLDEYIAALKIEIALTLFIWRYYQVEICPVLWFMTRYLPAFSSASADSEPQLHLTQKWDNEKLCKRVVACSIAQWFFCKRLLKCTQKHSVSLGLKLCVQLHRHTQTIHQPTLLSSYKPNMYFQSFYCTTRYEIL